MPISVVRRVTEYANNPYRPSAASNAPEPAEAAGKLGHQTFLNDGRVHLLGQRRDLRDGDGLQHVAHDGPHLLHDPRRGEIGPQRELREPAASLLERVEIHRARRGHAKVVVLGITDHADDLVLSGFARRT